MVQRKVPDKLGIQADHLSHDHISLKKPSSQHQDGKNRLPDLKKKMMKKSRSFKLSDIGHQSLKTSTSSALKKSNISQPGEPPPTLDVQATSPTILLTPKKQIPITKTVESSPNYMKSTSCFDARRELQSSQMSFRRNSTNSPVVSSSFNNKKPTKTSSSKLVRSLIKTPSFKLSRPASSKKSPRVALCTSDHLSHVQRATCSSTLKDSKFPSYLMLNHGGTESEGTSVMKVCPYTYCSLNGHHHHHASLPPLKCFLSARRRLLKNQKRVKLAVPSDKGIKGIDEEDAAEKVSMDFFIKIYAEKPKEDYEKKTDFVTVEGGGKEEAEHHIEEQVIESLSDGSPQSEIDADESPERYYEEIVTTETRIVEEFYVPPSDEEETDGTFTSGGDSEVTDMEWEEVKVSEAEIEDEAENSSEMGDESEPILGCSPDESVNSHDVDVTEEENEEVIASFQGHFAEGDIKELNLEIEESGQGSDGLMLDQLSSTADKLEDVSGNEENLRLDEAAEYLDAFMDVTSMEEQVQDQIEESEEGNVVLEVEDVIYLTSTQLCDASEGGNQETEESSEMDKEVEDDLSMESGVILQEAKEDADEANATEEIPSSDPLQATSEADEVVEKVEESSIDREILDSKDQNEKEHMTICEESVDHGDVKLNESEMAETKGENEDKKVGNKTKAEKKPSFLQGEEANDDQELHNKWNRSKRGMKDLEEESTNFNPREPNYLPLVAEPGSEKVDLKHQMMEERKNSEEWMIDYALQQTVTKLAPARKKKVALLVEAFEAVMPATKSESHRLSRHRHHHHSQAFPHAIRPIQACS